MLCCTIFQCEINKESIYLLDAIYLHGHPSVYLSIHRQLFVAPCCYLEELLLLLLPLLAALGHYGRLALPVGLTLGRLRWLQSQGLRLSSLLRR